MLHAIFCQVIYFVIFMFVILWMEYFGFYELLRFFYIRIIRVKIHTVRWINSKNFVVHSIRCAKVKVFLLFFVLLSLSLFSANRKQDGDWELTVTHDTSVWNVRNKEVKGRKALENIRNFDLLFLMFNRLIDKVCWKLCVCVFFYTERRRS